MSYNSGSNRAHNFKSASRFVLVRFWNYSRDYSLNCTPLGPITIPKQGRGRVYQPKPKAGLITLTETVIILDIKKTDSNNCFIIHRTKKNGSHVFASSLTASNTKRANLTWLLLSEIMHRGHTWHDYLWHWASLTWLLYNLQRWRHKRWFRNSLYSFGQSEKR